MRTALQRPGHIAAVASAVACLPATAWAHAFDVRYDLPAPLSYFVVGAAATVAFSFVIAALFAREASTDTDTQSTTIVNVPGLSVARLILRVLGLVLFALLIVAGLLGEGDPMTNITPTLAWIIFWVGLSLIAACVGNVWPAIDPWRSLFDLLGRSTAPLRYPRALGIWPAVILLLSIGWFELVYSQAAIPFNIAIVALVWSAVTLTGMALFGRETWQRNADVFAIYFDILGRFAPVAAGPVPGGIELRTPGRGLLVQDAGSAALTAFIIAMLSTVLFDGLLGGELWRLIMRVVGHDLPILFDGDGYIMGTAGLVGLWLIFLGAYVLTCWIMAKLVGDHRSIATVAGLFALTLVPIAVGYNIAHNFSMLVVQGQEFARLFSDPLGKGWNLFGTAKLAPAIGSIDAKTSWYVAIGAIVAGHVISTWLAHRVALREFGTPRRTLIAAVPLVILMMIYTGISLSIIAEPMVKFSPNRQTVVQIGGTVAATTELALQK